MITKEKLIHDDKDYKVIRRFLDNQDFGKEIFICKGCNKEFKQHARFSNHHVRVCNSNDK